ncbi:MAG: hypothetical protein DDT42_01668 [candidate division WS2 bacterium]|uniref:SWIM-type domain-containing protein n=1 Tax=Psychracetigena formicireducens TaxID=2986056 RepID=A0A9E2BJ35_PSYF1|nr:hypothetical protein [Candidatus Psychracetigena formicireducens]
MNNIKKVQTAMANAPELVAATSHQQELTPALVRKYLCPNATDGEIYFFITLCQKQNLDPFLREVYLAKSGDFPATIVTGKETFLKRAVRNPKYAGHRAWTEGEIPNLKGIAEVYVKGYEVPIHIEVDYKEYVGRKKDGSLNRMWAEKPRTMLRKVALVQALRESFPDDFGGMYSPEEINTIESDKLPTEKISIAPSESDKLPTEKISIIESDKLPTEKISIAPSESDKLLTENTAPLEAPNILPSEEKLQKKEAIYTVTQGATLWLYNIWKGDIRTYIVDTLKNECTCPAGAHTICKHREMVQEFVTKKIQPIKTKKFKIESNDKNKTKTGQEGANLATLPQISLISRLGEKAHLTPANILEMVGKFGCEKLEELTKENAREMIDELKGLAK